jgi:mRNA interferase RelE/StbE
LTWGVEISERAADQIKRLDRTAQQRIVRFLNERIATDENPRRTGRTLQGRHQGLWRYRVGDYRLVCQIQDDRLIVLVVHAGHRREVYR